MRNGFKIGQVFGVTIQVDWSWLFIFILIAWNLSTAFIELHPEWGIALAWGTGLLAALLFFASVLIHELSHSLVAKSQGLPVRNITLFLFGGVSNIQREPQSPAIEFMIAIVGPLTSFVIGGILTALAGASIGPLQALTASSDALGRLNPLATMALWLGSTNILLGIFNLIPGFPLDGGRVLRSILWAITGNLRRATHWAATIGQLVGWLFIFAGIMMIFGAELPILGGGIISGIWLAFIGWFLSSAAVQSYQQVVIEDILGDVPVSRLMRVNPPTVEPNTTVSSLVHDHIMQTDDYAFPVMEGGQMIGIVTLDDIRSVPRQLWDIKIIRDIMTPNKDMVVTTPEDNAAEALNKLMERDVRQLPVIRNGQLAGILRRRDIMRWLQLQSDIQIGAMP